MREFGFGLRIGRGGAGEPPAFSVSIVGSTDPETEAPVGIATDSIGTFAVIGEHADITYSATASGSPATPDAVIWSTENPVGDDKSGATATFGTGLSPTDIASADEGTLYLHAQKDSVWYTQSVAVRYPVGTLPAFSSQSFSEGVEGTYTHPAATGTGLTWTYAQVGAITGVTYVPGTRTFTFADTLAVQTGTSFGASATDQYGRAATGSPRTSTFSITDFVPAVITELVVTGVQGSDGVLPVEYTIDVTTENVAWGIGTGSTPTASALRAGTGMTDYGTVTLTAGTNSFEEALATGIDESSLNLWMVTPGSSTVVTAAASLPGVVPFAIDTTAPVFDGANSTPADGASDVALDAPLEADFDGPVIAGTGNFYIYEDAVLSETVAIESCTISDDGVTIPHSDFTQSAAVSIRWDAGVVKDAYGNGVSANTGDAAWNFAAAASAPFDPSDLFGSSEYGAIYEVSPTYCFTDTARTTNATVGDRVAAIEDRSGNGLHATQATLAARPYLRQSGSLYYLDYVGVTSGGLSVAITGSNLAAATYAAAMDWTSDSNFAFGSANSAAGNQVTGIRLRDGLAGAYNRNITFREQTIAVTATDPNAIIGSFSGSTFTVRANGTTSASNTDDGRSSENILGLGYFADSSPGYAEGFIFAAVLINRVLTTQETDDLEQWLANKSGAAI